MTPAIAALKAAVRAARADAGGIQAAAAATGVSTTQVGRWYDPASPDLPTLRQVIALEAAAGAPHVTRALAEIAGATVIELDPAPARAALGPLLARLAAEAAQVFAAGAEALGDNRLDAAERAKLLREVHQAQAALDQLRRHLQVPA